MSIIRILIFQQDPVELEILLKRLQKKGTLAKGTGDAGQVPDEAAAFKPDVIIVEPWDPFYGEILDIELLQKNQPHSGIVVLTGQIRPDMAAQVMGKGAFDLLIKPCPVEELLMAINRAAGIHL